MQSSSGDSSPRVRRLKVAVVGSGPAGLYTAEALVKQAALLPSPVAVSVDVLDRLPTPYGLVRYGVAPDHKSIKSVANYLRRVLESPGVTFVGGVHFGTDVTREDLLGAYDAVVYATGAMRDRRLGIPGEDLLGSHAATDFVNWYCGHPDVDPGAFTLDAESVAVIGVGNVAVDVARILARDPAELERDRHPRAGDGRRCARPRSARCTSSAAAAPRRPSSPPRSCASSASLAACTCPPTRPSSTWPSGFDRSGESAALATSDRRVRGNLVAMAGWAGASGASRRGPGRKLRLRFWLRPAEIQESSSGTVAGLRLERTRLSESGEFEGTGEFETLDAQLVLRSVGYQSVPLPGVPFDARTHTVPNASGRVLSETGEPLPGEYVAGWLKRGPTGVIGTNKADAAETVQALLADLAGGPDVGEGKLPRPGPAAPPGRRRVPRRRRRHDTGLDDTGLDDTVGGAAARCAVAPVLATRGVQPVSYAEWLRISAAEEELAASLGRGDRVKLPHRDAIWSAARPRPR